MTRSPFYFSLGFAHISVSNWFSNGTEADFSQVPLFNVSESKLLSEGYSTGNCPKSGLESCYPTSLGSGASYFGSPVCAFVFKTGPKLVLSVSVLPKVGEIVGNESRSVW